MSHDPTQIKGDHAELMVAAELKHCGWSVLFPHSGASKYDVVAERDGAFVRMQVKSSAFYDDYIEFRCYNSSGGEYGGSRTTYTADDIDGFAVYNQITDACYWVPVSDANQTTMRLNLTNDDAKNPACEYELTDRFSV